MRSRTRRTALTIASIAVGGYVMGTGGCLSFLGEEAFRTLDLCFIFDCTDAASGLLQPCLNQDPTSTRDDLLFIDCP